MFKFVTAYMLPISHACGSCDVASGVANLNLMLGHTSFYNIPCLYSYKYSSATGWLVYTCIHLWLLFEKCVVL